MPLGIEVGLSPGDIVLDGDPAPLPKKGSEPPSPIFGPCLLWPNGWVDQDGNWYGGGPWFRPGHIVLDGNPALLPKKGQSPPFWAHLYCGQRAGCIKMPIGTEIGLSTGDFVLDGDPAPPQKEGGAAQFSVHVYCG